MISQAIALGLIGSSTLAAGLSGRALAERGAVDFDLLDQQVSVSRDRFIQGQLNAQANLNSTSFLARKAHVRAVASALEVSGKKLGVRSAHHKRGTGVSTELQKRQSSATGYDGLTSYYYGQSYTPTPCTDIVYLMTVQIGTAAQSFQLGIDTGSADLWVYGSSLKSSTSQATFNSAKSSTYSSSNAAWSIEYGKGYEQGIIGQDLVKVGGYSVSNQSFAVANTISAAFSAQPLSGLMGFAFGALSGTGSTPFFESLMAAGTLGSSQQYFSVFLNRAPLSSATGAKVTGGELCLGCIDSAKYTGSINYVPVVSEGYWTVQASAMSYNGAAIASTSFYAALDTGSTIITLPTTVANAFYKAIGAKLASTNDGYYTITCTAAESIDVGIVFGGVNYRIAIDDLILGYVSASDMNNCVLAVVAGDQVDYNGNDVAIIGDTFLKNTFTVFSYSENGAPAVGLAVSTNAPSNSGQAIGASTSKASSTTKVSSTSSASFQMATYTSAVVTSVAPLSTLTVSDTTSATTSSVTTSSVTSSSTDATSATTSSTDSATTSSASDVVSYQTSFVTVDPSATADPAATSASAAASASHSTSDGQSLVASKILVALGAIAGAIGLFA